MKHINPIYKVLCLLWAVVGLTACEDVIDVDLDKGEPQLVVDAWVTNQPGAQTIRLTWSAPYFDSAPAKGVEDAEVSIKDSEGNVYTFENQNNGDYTWAPANPDEPLGKIGNKYTLTIRQGGETFQATSSLNDVPAIDSIAIEYKEKSLEGPEGHYAQFYARDLEGLGDCYWIKAYKNGVFLNKPSEINLAYDAGFNKGSKVDNLVFLEPIREGINPFPDEQEEDDEVPPYAIGDSIYVEIFSLTEETFDFMVFIREQMQNGGFFATPPANSPTNIVNLDDKSTVQALGFFNTSAVSSLGTKVTDKE
ncbi:DUF4249 domain-containing protein [Rapidithrix thailandica]|uniref:DUF4249 domain-containing protein n=1 Tax=Rapidithrix thailandica TaxID=413964 RepID=A0AAW9S1Z8_9BACT